MGSLKKIAALLATIGVIVAAVVFIPSCTSIDFATLKYGLRPEVSQPQKEIVLASPTEEVEAPTRDRYLCEMRANQYLDHAKRDYYNGSLDDALRRLDRARDLDCTNFAVSRLTGQIFFEKSLYRKAFNEWARANQLPNDEQTIVRDLDVVKRLIRYCRNEIDRLQRNVYHDPNDRISLARLKELQSRVAE